MSAQGKSPLERAADLSAWLIRTGKQPPAKAHYIAGRKFGVALHEVAQLVGARGGRRLGKRREGTAEIEHAGQPSAGVPVEATFAAAFEVLSVSGDNATGRATLVLRTRSSALIDYPLPPDCVVLLEGAALIVAGEVIDVECLFERDANGQDRYTLRRLLRRLGRIDQ